MAYKNEINYFFQDKNGKVLNVVKPVVIKPEPIESATAATTTVYAAATSSSNNNMVAYHQLNTTNQPQFIRIDGEDTAYTILTHQGSPDDSNSIMEQQQQQQQQQQRFITKYEMPDMSVVKTEDNYEKYTPISNTKTKSKLHSINMGSSSSHHTPSAVQRKRKPDKAGKGLRHFSMKVCEKVRHKGTTTYNEVADELVTEELQNNSQDSTNCDQKNIRRRVYDALNVLMAMQIISKDKKEIHWIGLPTNSMEQQTSSFEKENEERRERINQKNQQLRELLLQQIAFKSLIERNKEAERQGNIPTPNSSIQLPFIIVNTHKATKINCSVTNDKSEYIFKFDDKFEMHDDAEVLKRMGLLFGLDKGQCSFEDIERAKSLVPPNFEKYVEAYGSGLLNCDSDADIDVDPDVLHHHQHHQHPHPHHHQQHRHQHHGGGNVDDEMQSFLLEHNNTGNDSHQDSGAGVGDVDDAADDDDDDDDEDDRYPCNVVIKSPALDDDDYRNHSDID